jgi:hypothetical protein
LSSITLGDVGTEAEAEAGDVVGVGVEDGVDIIHLIKLMKIVDRKGPGRAGGRFDALYSVE